MKYRVEHSKSKEFRVYRKFHYHTGLKLGVRGFLSVVFLAIGIFILMPDPDELLIYGAILPVLSKSLGISLKQALILAATTFKCIGFVFLVAALAVGGRYIKDKLKMQVKSQVNKIGNIRNKLSACF
jgi:hypothetical protein